MVISSCRARWSIVFFPFLCSCNFSLLFRFIRGFCTFFSSGWCWNSFFSIDRALPMIVHEVNDMMVLCNISMFISFRTLFFFIPIFISNSWLGLLLRASDVHFGFSGIIAEKRLGIEKYALARIHSHDDSCWFYTYIISSHHFYLDVLHYL